MIILKSEKSSRLAVLTATVSRNAGGLFESVRHLHQEISMSMPTQVISFHDEFTDEDLPLWDPLKVRLVSHIGPRTLSYSPRMRRVLDEINPDLIHVHGIWQGPSIASFQYRIKRNIPALVSPRGMLDPWALDNARWKKKLAGCLFENKHLGSVSCLHALCESEAAAMREYGLTSPICVVPNGVSLPNKNEKPHPKGRKRLLFLGRIHPKKGLMQAIRAWSKVNSEKDWQFVVAGWDQGGHESELKSLCEGLGVSYEEIPASELLAKQDGKGENASVLFVGPAFGDTKRALLEGACAFILPSYSEGLPMSVLEAWSYRLPVLMTDQCNLPDGFAAAAAIRLVSEHDSAQLFSGISEALRQLFEMSEEDCKSMGDRGRNLVELKYTWEIVGKEMKKVYDWLLVGGDLPNCVHQKHT